MFLFCFLTMFPSTGQNQLPSPEEAKKIKLKPKTWQKVDAVVAKISVANLEERKARGMYKGLNLE